MKAENDFWKSQLQKWTVLDIPDRLSEVLFGLIMVLTFTGTISVSTSGKQEVRELLWAALGCNLAWGIVDAIMYIMDTIIGRSYNIRQLDKINNTINKEDNRNTFKDSMPPLVSEIMTDSEIDQLTERIRQLPKEDIKVTLTFKDFRIAGEIFLLVFLSTFPVALPFLLFKEVDQAMRISNLIALVLLFICGYSLAKYSGLKPFLTAVIYTVIGVFLVVLTIYLGG